MINQQNLSDAIYRMALKGGYVFAFSKRVASDMPDLSWEAYRNKLADNSGFCGYSEVAIRNAFGR